VSDAAEWRFPIINNCSLFEVASQRWDVSSGIGYRLCLGHFFPLVGRSWIEPLALRCIQFPHQLADADARPEMYLADPALHVLVVALPGVCGQSSGYCQCAAARSRDRRNQA